MLETSNNQSPSSLQATASGVPIVESDAAYEASLLFTAEAIEENCPRILRDYGKRINVHSRRRTNTTKSPNSIIGLPRNFSPKRKNSVTMAASPHFIKSIARM
jgi:hypothetical protein